MENRHEEDDNRNIYNPDKKPNPWYSQQFEWDKGTMWKSLNQITPEKKDGLVPPPKDW